jgi:hypothetical protein
MDDRREYTWKVFQQCLTRSKNSTNKYWILLFVMTVKAICQRVGEVTRKDLQINWIKENLGDE